MMLILILIKSNAFRRSNNTKQLFHLKLDLFNKLNKVLDRRVAAFVRA